MISTQAVMLIGFLILLYVIMNRKDADGPYSTFFWICVLTFLLPVVGFHFHHPANRDAGFLILFAMTFAGIIVGMEHSGRESYLSSFILLAQIFVFTMFIWWL